MGVASSPEVVAEPNPRGCGGVVVEAVVEVVELVVEADVDVEGEPVDVGAVVFAADG